jgi:hypothetical protein
VAEQSLSRIIHFKAELLEAIARSQELLQESTRLLDESFQTVERSRQLLETSYEVLDRAKRIAKLDLKAWIIQLLPLFAQLVPYGLC